MIKVEIERQFVPNPMKDLVKDTQKMVWNGQAEMLSETIKEQSKGYACDKHPDQISVLVIRPDGDRMSLDKSGFCCQEFANLVQLNYTL